MAYQRYSIKKRYCDNLGAKAEPTRPKNTMEPLLSPPLFWRKKEEEGEKEEKKEEISPLFKNF